MATFPITYVTYDNLRSYLGQDSGDGDVATVKQFAERASRQFERWCRGRTFYPTLSTRYYESDALDGDGLTLWVDNDLLEMSTLTNGDSDETEIASTEYWLVHRNYGPPYYGIRIKSASTSSWEWDTDYWVNVAAYWGYHNDWSNAWQDSGDTVEDAGGISASATTITVNDADGDDIYGTSSRFHVMQLVKIDDEYLWTTAVTGSSTNTLTVVRGVLGTTAAAHDKDTSIYVYQPMADIVQAVADLAKYMYLHKDSQDRDGDVQAFPEIGAVNIPQGIPKTTLNAVETYRRRL